MHETRHDEMDTHGSPVRFSYSCLTMKLQRPREREGVLWVLGAAIGPADSAKAVGLIPEKGNDFLVCDVHRVLTDIYRSKGEREETIRASSRNPILFPLARSSVWVYFSLADPFSPRRQVHRRTRPP